MNPIDRLFEKLRAEANKAFIPFVSAGDPDGRATVAVVQEMLRRGASLIEIGFPYSDAIADGPVIHAAGTTALAAGATLDSVLADCERGNDEEVTGQEEAAAKRAEKAAEKAEREEARAEKKAEREQARADRERGNSSSAPGKDK